MPGTCIIHYNGHEEYSSIKPISNLNELRIREAKALRETAGGETAGGENFHEAQCNTIPDIINNTHGIHLTPCYKKFTLFISKSNQDTNKKPRLSTRTINPSQLTVYPKECNICGKYRFKHNTAHIFPQSITTLNACENIKAAAKRKNLNLYAEINDLDLIAK